MLIEPPEGGFFMSKSRRFGISGEKRKTKRTGLNRDNN